MTRRKLDSGKTTAAPVLALSRPVQRGDGAVGMPARRSVRRHAPALSPLARSSINADQAETPNPVSATMVRALDGPAQRLIRRSFWPQPDKGVLHLHRRLPPKLPIEVFGPKWRQWITMTAEAAACPPDYVVARSPAPRC